MPEKKPGVLQHFDYIEVGTSDWGTLTHYCAKQWTYASRLGLEMHPRCADPRQARGIAVEMVKEYLNVLPSLPRLTKIEAAMDENRGLAAAHFVPRETAHLHMGQFLAPLGGERWGGPEVDVMWYAKSLSSLGCPHPELIGMLKDIGHEEFLQKRDVRVLSWGDLCQECGVGSVDVLQLDCEGKDCAIIRGLLAHCRTHPKRRPRIIQFEVNYLTEQKEVQETIKALRTVGYKIKWQGDQNCLLELKKHGRMTRLRKHGKYVVENNGTTSTSHKP